MVPTGLGAFLSNVLFSLELRPPSTQIWLLRAIYRGRGVNKDGPLCLPRKVEMGLLASAPESEQFSRPHSGALLLSRYVPPERVELG